MFYWSIKTIFAPLLFLFFKPRITGRKHLKTKGGLIILSNHVSLMDPVFVSHVFGRKIYWMAKIELFKNKLAGWFLKRLGAFPVHRGAGDLASIRHAMRILRAGRVLGIFPEGTRIKTGEIGVFEPGVAMMALKTGSPVLPVYIDGGYGLFRRARVAAGEKIDLSAFTGGVHTPAAVAQCTDYLRAKMTLLKESLQGGIAR